jgi:hypothetical protein
MSNVSNADKVKWREAIVKNIYYQNTQDYRDSIKKILTAPWIMKMKQVLKFQLDIFDCFWEGRSALDDAIRSCKVIEQARSSDEVDETELAQLEKENYVYVNYSRYRERYQKSWEIWSQAPQEDDLWPLTSV